MAARLATRSELLGFAKDLCRENPQIAATVLAITGRMITVDCWGQKASDAHLLLAAHWLTLISNDGVSPAGPLTSVMLGKISEGYAAPQMQDDAELATTDFGKLYLALRKTLLILPIASC